MKFIVDKLPENDCVCPLNFDGLYCKIDDGYCTNVENKGVCKGLMTIDTYFQFLQGSSREYAIRTGKCPMCPDCPDGCPLENPADPKNRQEYHKSLPYCFEGSNTAHKYEDLSADVMRNRIVDDKLKKVVAVDVEIKLTENDIFNWLMSCKNPDTLRNLGRAALSFARGLENPDDDDFRSRA